jgi:hypothetical protein
MSRPSPVLRPESRPQESEQDDKWSFCLTAGTLCRANKVGSRSPARSARAIRGPVAPVMSATTGWSYRSISVNAFCMCGICEAAYSSRRAR